MMATTHWNPLPKTMVDFSSLQRSPNKTSFYSILQFNHRGFFYLKEEIVQGKVKGIHRPNIYNTYYITEM